MWFRKGFVHSDVNDTNVLFKKSKAPAHEVAALIDFGDSCYDYILYDVGVAAGYACMHQTIPTAVTVAAVIRGFCKGVDGDASLPPRAAVEVIYAAALGRLLLSLTCGLEQMTLDPEDEYVAHTVAPCKEAVLRQLEEFPSLDDAIEAVCKAMLIDSVGLG